MFQYRYESYEERKEIGCHDIEKVLVKDGGVDAVYFFQGSIFDATLLLFATLSVLTSFGN